MAFEETALHDRYALVNLVVSPGTQISSRTSTVIEKLAASYGSGGDGNNHQAVIVALTARSKAGCKLITIVEIAKRELVARGLKVFQYTSLTSELIKVPRRSEKGQRDRENARGDGGESSDDAFETMGAVVESEMKKRSVPVMTIYLSMVQVRELKTAFTEQT